VAAEAVANKAAPGKDRADHEAAMAAHIGQHAMATTLAAGATNEEAIVARVAAHAAALGAGDTVQDQTSKAHTKRQQWLNKGGNNNGKENNGEDGPKDSEDKGWRQRHTPRPDLCQIIDTHSHTT